MDSRFAHLDLDALYGIPLMCPVDRCQAQMAPVEMIAHLLMRHSPHVSMLQLKADWPTEYELDLDNLLPGRNHAVGVIAYGGTPKSGGSCPVTSELQIVHHLPVILMLYVSPSHPTTEQAFIFYLISPVASKQVSGDVSLLDSDHGKEKRGLRCLRKGQESPRTHSNALLYCNVDYLLYMESDIRELCLCEKHRRLFVKVVLHGEPDLFEADAQVRAESKVTHWD